MLVTPTSGGDFEELQDAPQRNPYPVRTVIQFIAEFVDGFFQDEGVKQDL